MNIWYLSYNRFEKRIIERWNKSGFKYHNGHINALRHAYETLLVWRCDEKISAKNKRLAEDKKQLELKL